MASGWDLRKTSRYSERGKARHFNEDECEDSEPHSEIWGSRPLEDRHSRNLPGERFQYATRNTNNGGRGYRSPSGQFTSRQAAPSTSWRKPNGVQENTAGPESGSWRIKHKSCTVRVDKAERLEGSQDMGGSECVTRDYFRRPGRQVAPSKSENQRREDQGPPFRHGSSARPYDGDSKDHISFSSTDETRHKQDKYHQSLFPYKTERKAKALPFTDQDLLDFMDKEPSEVLLELVTNKEKCLELFSMDELNDHTLILIVRVLSCMCYLDPVSESVYTQDLNIVLSMMETCLFLSKHLTRYLVGLSTKQAVGDSSDTDEVQTLASDARLILKLLHLFLQNKSTGHAEVGVVLILLQKVVTSAALNNEEFDPAGQLMTEVEQLKEYCHSVEQLQTTARQRSMEKPPPNNFRDIPIFPGCKELRQKTKPFLRKNIVRGAYNDVEHYLDVQFRLLREDFVSPLREGVAEFLADPSVRPQDIRMYHNVTIGGQKMEKHVLTHTLQFHMKGRRPERWESSKRLMYGSFVCLSRDNFENILCGTVERRNPEDLKEGLVDVCFLTKMDKGSLRPARGAYVMAESAGYFESYRHVLQALQLMNVDNFPFERYIVGVSSRVEPPVYLRGDDPVEYDLRTLVLGTDDSLNLDIKAESIMEAAYVPVLDRESWPSAENLHLDESQKAAMQTALTKEFAIIQGPPGTGKTYIGLKIVKLLLGNSPTNYFLRYKTKSPILVVCYTNHALDQFLEGIIAFGEENVVRVGSRSSSEILEEKNISFIRKRRRNKYEYKENMEKLQHVREQLQIEEAVIQRLLLKLDLPRKVILAVLALKEYMSRDHYKQLSQQMTRSKQTSSDPSATLLRWLNIEEMAKETDIRPANKSQEMLQESEEVDRIEVQVDVDRIQQERLIDDESFSDQDHQGQRQSLEEEILKNAAGSKRVIGSSSQAELQRSNTMTNEETSRVRQIWSLGVCDRWRLYRLWVNRYKEKLSKELSSHREKYDKLKEEMEDISSKEDLDILREANVIGMTTTGAARHQALLHRLGPRIVVVEEAAEVLEAHIVTSLTAKCQHLILIGDHQQLKPNPTVYRLAKLFKLDTSLFERMINNGVPCRSLTHQHRMRPEISQIMRKHFYDNLQDDDSVLNMDSIKGVLQTVFFVNHGHLEDGVDDNRTRSNKFEAEFLVELCRYLLHQGYNPSQITVLTTYTGQLFCLRQLMDKATFEGVRVCVVDNYQGEENDIILLSLVRSNEEGSIGFLSTSNRVCVALSRAKMGFYCIGNASILKKSKLWHDIIGTLEVDIRIGPSLPLVCRNHPPKITHVATALDFQKKVPCGGCDKMCEYKLKCEHVCPLFCHPCDTDHEKYKCQEPCARFCTTGVHLCPLLCYKPCGLCSENMPKLMTGCGHEIQVPCFKFENATCTDPCPEAFSICGHRCPNECGQRCPETCPAKCEKKLVCGHRCSEPCGRPCCQYCKVQVKTSLPTCGHNVTDDCSKDPGEIKCRTRVNRLRSVCGHHIEMFCFEEPNSIECHKNCEKTLSCGHRCPNVCGKPCEVADNRRPRGAHYRKEGDMKRCEEIVEKAYQSCDHSIKLPCHRDLSSVPCSHTCGRVLACGHRCSKICSDTCPLDKLEGRLMRRYADSWETFSSFCTDKCEKLLPCGHLCPNKCGEPCADGSLDASSSYGFSTNCEKLVTKRLPDCGHNLTVKCHEDVASMSCTEICKKELSCGHLCTEKCSMLCRCYFKMKKTLPRCKHVVLLPCYQDIDSYLCIKKCKRELQCGHQCPNKCGELCRVSGTERCGKILQCGHQCPNMCSEPCSGEEASSMEKLRMYRRHKPSKRCTENVRKVFPCGHSQDVICWSSNSISCSQVCNTVLECAHKCSGDCMSCKQDSKHGQCFKACCRKLLCGHSCRTKCRMLCPPDCLTCQRQSSQRRDFVDSENLCKHNLKHRKLKNNACILSCQIKLHCKHQCIGVCGEPCPPYCRVCTSGVMECFVFPYQMSFRKHVTFIYLPDCKHIIETRLLDRMVADFKTSLESGYVKIRSILCPKCNEPIGNCRRYNEVLLVIDKSVQTAKEKCIKARQTASVSDNSGCRSGGSGISSWTDEHASASMAFAVGGWIRCPQGHVFCQDKVEQQQEPGCPECSP